MATCFVLVTGTMRSGTTLMGELLYASAYGRPMHPQLAFATDTYDIIRRSLYRIQKSRGVEIGHPFGSLDVEEPILKATLEELDGRTFPGSVADELKRQILARAPVPQDALCVGNKATDVLIEFDVLRRVFGQARLIVLIRDPRDVLASNIARVGAERDLDGLTVLASVANLGLFLAERRHDPDLMVVRYEELVRSPRPAIERILGFVGLDGNSYDWAALTRGEIASNSSYGASKGDGFDRGQGVGSASVGQFRTRLSSAQLYAVERLLKRHMAEFGYDRHGADDAADVPFYLNDFLPALIGQSRKVGLSLEGLRRLLEADGLSGCIEDVERRSSLATPLVKGGSPGWREFANLLPACESCHPERRSGQTVMADVRVAIVRRDWADVERFVEEMVSGEQNGERLSRMILTIVGQTATPADASDYVGWALAQGRKHWRWLHTRRLSLLAAGGSPAECASALNDFIRQIELHLVQYPNDMTARLTKVENVSRFGDASSRGGLAADLASLQAGLSDGRLPEAQRKRIEDALDRCRPQGGTHPPETKSGDATERVL